MSGFLSGRTSLTTVQTADIAADAITLAKLASGTDGNIISYDASGNPVAIATGADGQVLTSAGAGAQPAFETAGGNTPAFEAYLSSDQTVASADTYTKVSIDTEVFDSDSKYDNSTNYRFTPTVAGKYFVYGQIRPKHASAHYLLAIKIAIYLNGSIYMETATITASHPYYTTGTEADRSIYTVMDLDADDYIELWGSIGEYSSGTKTFATGTKSTSFGAYKLGV